MLIYKGFVTDLSVCDVTGKVFARVVNLENDKEMVFQGNTVADVERQFQQSIDRLLETCYT